MPSIKIESQNSHPPEEAFRRVRDLLANDPGLRKLDASYECTFKEDNRQGEVKGKQFSAHIDVQPNGDGSRVEIRVDLAFLLSPFKSQVKSTLERKLEAALS